MCTLVEIIEGYVHFVLRRVQSKNTILNVASKSRGVRLEIKLDVPRFGLNTPAGPLHLAFPSAKSADNRHKRQAVNSGSLLIDVRVLANQYQW
jgi:hypothetical protein